MRKWVLFYSVILTSFLSTSVVFAGEPLFGYTYTTDTTPAGKWELEQWITDRDTQAHGEFHHFHFNTEVEYGVTDRLQVSLYTNFMCDNDHNNSVAGRTEGIEIPSSHNRNSRYQAFRYDGETVEILYRLMSPYTDPFGFAVYVEPELSPTDAGLEFRTIFQKDFLDDQLVFALNVWVEFEREKGSNLVDPGSGEIPNGAWADATMLETDFGASYRFAPNWFIGLEARNHNEYGGWTLKHEAQDHTAFFVGPDIHYATQSWFFTFSALRQVAAVAYTDEQRAQMRSNLLYGDEHTLWDGIRLKIGFPF
jgi:hypothetical protein